MLGLVLAASAGLCGSLASVFGKLAMAGQAALTTCQQGTALLTALWVGEMAESLGAGQAEQSGLFVSCEDVSMSIIPKKLR